MIAFEPERSSNNWQVPAFRQCCTLSCNVGKHNPMVMLQIHLQRLPEQNDGIRARALSKGPERHSLSTVVQRVLFCRQ